MHEQGKFDTEMIIIPNGLEEYMGFDTNNELIFINSLQFLSLYIDSLSRNSGQYDFKYLSKKFDCNLLNLVKQKWLLPQ